MLELILMITIVNCTIFVYFWIFVKSLDHTHK